MKELVKVFNYSEKKIRTIVLDGQPWFCGKDACSVLTIVDHKQALRELDSDEMGVYKVPPHGNDTKSRRMTFVNESGLYSLIFSSNKPEAKKFKKWVTSEVLPSIRKNGSYSLRSLILSNPITWEKTFPEEFFREVMRVYNYSYHPKIGTPQFVGNFINKYIYECLDRSMTKELKLARLDYKNTTDEFHFLHQFLKEDGRIPLKNHIVSITTLLKASATITQFDTAYNRVFVYKNQLNLYLK